MAEAEDTQPTAKEYNYSRPSQLDDFTKLRVLKQWFRDDSQHSAKWRTEAKEDFDFKAGRQWTPDEISQLHEQLRPEIVFNRSLTIIKAVAGFEINSRHDIQFLPRKIEDTAVNEVLTGASKWMGDECEAEDEESEAFQDCVTCGMGWCLSDDAMVRLPNTHFATTRLYTGSVIQIDLENGKQLTGTPNHPVLTDRGWKCLYELKEGDNLVTSGFLERVKGLPIEQFDKMESRLKDKIDAFRTGREALCVPTASNDFYSDGRGSKVHVVYADGLLLNDFRKAAFSKQAKQLAFISRYFASAGRLLLARARDIRRALNAAVSSTTISLIHLLSGEINSLPLCSQRVASGSEPSRNSLSADFVLADCYADLERRHAFVEIHGGDIRDRNFRAFVAAPVAKRVASAFETDSYRGTRYSDYIADFVEWKPLLEIEVRKLARGNSALGAYGTRVVAQRSYDVTDFPVHDVGTSLGFFIAGDVITSNTFARISYEEDSAGLYEEGEINPLEMYWDYSARKRNIVDSRRRAWLRKMPLSDARSMFPNHEDFQLDAKWAVGLEPEEQTKTIEEKRHREENAGDNEIERYEVYIVQMQWWERVPYWLVADPTTNKKIELPDKKYTQLAKRMKAFGMNPIAVKIYKREYFQAFIGGVILESGPAPLPDRFSFECITGEQDKNKGTWFGLVRMMRDPQKWANKWLSQTLHIMNSAAKGGIMAEADAFDDQRQAEESYARPEAITWMKKGAIAQGKWAQKPAATFPAGFFNLLEFAISSLRDVTGINLELLGQKDINQPGILEAQRKQAGMTVLATMFDSLRRFRKRVGRIRLYFIQNFLSDGRLVRVVGQDGAKVIPLIRDKCLGEYDVIVDDAPTSPNQKQANWAIIAPLLPMFKDQLMANPQVFLEILNFSPLPSRLVEAIKVSMQKQTPQQQQNEQTAAMMQKLAIAEKVSTITKNQSTAEMQDAKAGASQATAMYDVAIATNLLRKNNMEGAAQHLENLHKAAQIDKTQAETERTQAQTHGEHADTTATHIGSLIDALTPIPQPQQAQPQAA